MKPGMVVQGCDPSSGEVEAGRLLLGDQPELHSKTLSLKKKTEAAAAAAGVGQLLSEPPSHPSVLGDQLWDSFGRIITH